MLTLAIIEDATPIRASSLQNSNEVAPVWIDTALSLSVYRPERGESYLAGFFLRYCFRIWCFMLNRYTKSALLCAMLPIGLFGSGCSTSSSQPTAGHPGYDEFSAGDFTKAKIDFTTDYNKQPEAAWAEFNIADSYRQEGDNTRANAMFSRAAANGKDAHPDLFLELGGDAHGASVTEMACRHLHEDHQRDVNCGDRMAEIQSTQAPEPSEAAATYVPPETPPKQDRN
jgi:hypothetical protein